MRIEEKIEKYLMKENEKAKNPEFSDKKFGKLLDPGDEIKITDLNTNKSTKATVGKFDGLEYKLKGKSDMENLGHSGFEIIDDNIWIVVGTEIDRGKCAS